MVEMKIEIFDAEFSKTETNDLIKIKVKSNLILKIGDKQFFREVSNTISITDNTELFELLMLC
jgi:hypothetical protein